MIKLGGGWDEKLADIFNDENYLQIREFLKEEFVICHVSCYYYDYWFPKQFLAFFMKIHFVHNYLFKIRKF